MRIAIARRPLALLVAAVACGSPPQPSSLEPSPQLAEVEHWETDPEALAECGKLQAAAIGASRPPIFLGTEVDRPAEMLPFWEHPGERQLPQRELPRRNAAVLMVVLVRHTGQADRNSVRIIRASDPHFGAAGVDVVRQAHYRPAKRAGVAVDQCLIVLWRRAITP